MKKQIIILCLLSFIASSAWAKHYPDSVMNLSNKERRIEKGWNFEFYGGLGAGRYEFKQLGDNNFTPAHTKSRFAFPSWDAGLSINYYFLPWMGIGAGAEFHNYVNTTAITGPWTYNGTDSENEEYTFTATSSSLSETENISMLEVPIAFRFRAIPAKVGFIGSLGVKLGFPMMNRYALDKNGTIKNTVTYEKWNLELQNVTGVIEDVTVTSQNSSYSKFSKLNYAAFAEVGVLIQLTQRLDLAISAFGSYYINDVISEHGTAELGFANNYTVTNYYQAPFTNNYTGVLNSNEVKELHPWSVGLKVGIQINANRTRAQREYDRMMATKDWDYEFDDEEYYVEPDTTEQTVEEEEITEVPVIIENTTEEEEVTEVPVTETPKEDEPITRDEALKRIQKLANENDINICTEICPPQTVIIHDTIVQYVQQLDEMLSTSVIFFNLDDTEPILEPADVLVNLAKKLQQHPTMRVRINGHACKLGYPAYNMRLAQRRAEVIAARLRALGVRDDQMTIQSLGSKHPFRYNGIHTLSKDRRVEIIPEGVGYPAETTETVIPGSRLAQIARRHYGEPEYWVFIYEANRQKISDPDDIQIGTELIIPDLSKRLHGMSKDHVLAEVARLKAQMKPKKK